MASEQDTGELIDKSNHKSVNKKRLTKLKGGLTARYLYDQPLISYLEDNEQPHFILAAREKAPNFSGPNPPSWSGENLDGMAMHMITNERWLIVTGIKSGDKYFEVPLEELTISNHSTGGMGHEITIETNEYSIDIPIGNMYDAEEVESAVYYLSEPSDSQSNRPSPSELVSNARHDSVTEKLLTSTDGGLITDYLKDKPLIEYLQENEHPHYIFANDMPPEFSGPKNPHWTGGKGYKNMHMVTDRRWLIVSGHKDGDRTFEIPFESIDFVEITGSGMNKKLEIETDETFISFSLGIAGNMSEEIESVKKYLDSKTSTTSSSSKPDKKTIIDVDNPEQDNLYAKLVVPTKSSGATFTSQGWSIGGDIVRRSSSKGEIEEESWENYVKKLVLYDDHIEIGITHGDMSLTSDNTIHQNIRLNLSDISDARTQKIEMKSGFVFETAEDVYQFKLGKKGMGSKAKGSDAHEIAQKFKKAVRDAPKEKPEQSASSSKEDASVSDPMEKLSQIKDLHDQGVLTDEEFEEKKKELLDQI